MTYRTTHTNLRKICFLLSDLLRVKLSAAPQWNHDLRSVWPDRCLVCRGPSVTPPPVPCPACGRDRGVNEQPANGPAWAGCPYQPAGYGRVDVVILTALAVEEAAVVRAIGTCSTSQWQGATIHLGEVAGYRVLVFPIGGMGNVNAAVTAQMVISEWRPDCLLLVGIAGGAPCHSGGMPLGDILIADQFVGYEQARITQDGAVRRFEVYRPDRRLLDCARSIRATAWARRLAAPRPGDPAGRVQPRVHVGPVLTGAKVLADETTLAGLRAVWPRVIGVEMESLGVALAAYRNGPRFLMVKAVSDLADRSKNDVWREYAADAAACFAVAVIAASSGLGAGFPAYSVPWYEPQRVAPVVVAAVFAGGLLILVHAGPSQLAAFRPWVWVVAVVALVTGRISAVRPRPGRARPPAAGRGDPLPSRQTEVHLDLATAVDCGHERMTIPCAQPAKIPGRLAKATRALHVGALYFARAGSLARATAARWFQALITVTRTWWPGHPG